VAGNSSSLELLYLYYSTKKDFVKSWVLGYNKNALKERNKLEFSSYDYWYQRIIFEKN